MQVLVNSDHHIVTGEDLTERVQGVVEGRLDRFSERITRVEVHLNDLNSSKLGERDTRKPLRCLMEARVGGIKPIAVSHEAPTLTEAIHVAADKLERALDHAFGKLEDTAGRAAERRAPAQDAKPGGPAGTDGHLAGQVASIEALQELERTEADHRGGP